MKSIICKVIIVLLTPILAIALERISVQNVATPIGNDDTFDSDISGDGRYTVFSSNAYNLVEGDTNNKTDIFIHDSYSGKTERILAYNGEQPDGNSRSPAINNNGTFIVFESDATNLVVNDHNNKSDIFLYDRINATIQRISMRDSSHENNNSSTNPTISGSGDIIVFQGFDGNLTDNDNNGYSDVFIYERSSSKLSLISRNSVALGDGSSQNADITSDGRYIVYDSGAENLTSEALTHYKYYIYRFDRDTNNTVLISKNTANGSCYKPSISDDGNLVTFESLATNLIADDTEGNKDIFLHNISAVTTQRISQNSDGDGGDLNSQNPKISADGNYILFDSRSNNLVTGDINSATDIFAYNLSSSHLKRISTEQNSNTSSNYDSTEPSTSGDGNYIAFRSFSAQFVDEDSNDRSDIFIYSQNKNSYIITSRKDNGNGDSISPSLNEDGRYIAFSSESPYLVTGDDNGADDIFVYDQYTKETSVISLTNSGNFANGDSLQPSIDCKGRYVTFASYARDIATYDGNPLNYDIYLHDRVSHTSKLITNSEPTRHFNPQISCDSNFIVFEANATNYDTRCTNGKTHIYLYDRNSDKIECISVDTLGVQGLDDSHNPSVSGDGKYVVFDSVSDTLISTDTEGYCDVFIRNREVNTTMRISEDSSGNGANSTSDSASISEDGKYIVYESWATSLDSRDTNVYADIYLFDMNDYSTRCISLAYDKTAANGSSLHPSISSDGRYVTFYSRASNLVPSDTNNQWDVFVFDTEKNTTSLLSISDSHIQSDGASHKPAISSDGSYIAFPSDATNLTKDDYNDKTDIFVDNNTLYEPKNSFLPSVIMYLIQ